MLKDNNLQSLIDLTTCEVFYGELIFCFSNENFSFLLIIV